jgi:hypothetical protein
MRTAEVRLAALDDEQRSARIRLAEVLQNNPAICFAPRSSITAELCMAAVKQLEQLEKSAQKTGERLIYISGKISGDPLYKQKFNDAEEELINAGYIVCNPARYAPCDVEWSKAMRMVVAIMLQCGGVALLPDWEESRGAKIEERLARDTGIETLPIAGWLKRAADGAK